MALLMSTRAELSLSRIVIRRRRPALACICLVFFDFIGWGQEAQALDSDENLASGSCDLGPKSDDSADESSENDDGVFRKVFAKFKPLAKENILSSIKGHDLFPAFLEYRVQKKIGGEFGSDSTAAMIFYVGMDGLIVRVFLDCNTQYFASKS